ncbi:hypothetical protein ACHHYP_15652 [Achlya hypogyna]|uniref:DUF4349 domain-containing protein n=1 Tax=Achlya hypogyna TaxID=1202772 RepID=A0A1V9YAF1_ACHHY|nr:hypothetical protein ACHHYP_15652 [Achlya hypogyna]
MTPRFRQSFVVLLAFIVACGLGTFSEVTIDTTSVEDHGLTLSGGAPKFQFLAEHDGRVGETSFSSGRAAYANDHNGIVLESGEVVSHAQAASTKPSPSAQSPSSLSSSTMLVWKGDVLLRAARDTQAFEAAKKLIQALLKGRGYLEAVADSNKKQHLSTRCVTPDRKPVACPPYSAPRFEILRTWTITWRGEDFEDVMAAIEAVPGRVRNVTLESKQANREDVSAAYKDAEGRSATLVKTRDTLEKVMERSGTVTEIASVVTKIHDVTAKIEAAKREMLRTAAAVRLSTMRIRLEEDSAYEVVIKAPAIRANCTTLVSRVQTTFRRALAILTQGVELVVDLAIYAIVLGLPLTAVILAAGKTAAHLWRHRHYETLA